MYFEWGQTDSTTEVEEKTTFFSNDLYANIKYILNLFYLVLTKKIGLCLPALHLGLCTVYLVQKCNQTDYN